MSAALLRFRLRLAVSAVLSFLSSVPLLRSRPRLAVSAVPSSGTIILATLW